MQMPIAESARREKVPEELCCPITCDIFEEPVIVWLDPESNQTYSKKALYKYIDNCYTDGKPIVDPITQKEFDPNKHIGPNRFAETVVENWKKSHSISIENEKSPSLDRTEIDEIDVQCRREYEALRRRREKLKLLRKEIQRNKDEENQKRARKNVNYNQLTVQELVALVRDGSTVGERENAARALRTLACNNDTNQVKIADAGGIVPLVALVRDGSTAGERHYAAWALGILAFNDANQVKIADAGGIATLVALVRDGSTVKERHYAVGALNNLACKNAANKVKIADAGGIAPLVALVRDGSTAGERENAALALSSLASDNDANRVKIADAGGIVPLVALVQDGSTTGERDGAARALGSLAKNNNCKNTIKQSRHIIQSKYDAEPDTTMKRDMQNLLRRLQ